MLNERSYQNAEATLELCVFSVDALGIKLTHWCTRAIKKAKLFARQDTTDEQASCYFRYGQALASQGRNYDAENAFQQCVELNGGRRCLLLIDCLSHLAMLQKALGKQAEAEASINEAFETLEIIDAQSEGGDAQVAAFLPQLAEVFKSCGMIKQAMVAQAHALSHTSKRFTAMQVQTANVIGSLG